MDLLAIGASRQSDSISCRGETTQQLQNKKDLLDTGMILADTQTAKAPHHIHMTETQKTLCNEKNQCDVFNLGSC